MGKKRLMTTVLFVAKARAANNEKLIQAIESRSLEDVRHVLESRPDASVRSMPGNYVPLLLATSLGYDEIVQELLTGGAEVDVRNDDNDSALIIASRKGHVKVVKLLLDNRADVHARNNNGSTPLLAAVANRHRDVVELLLLKNADTNAKDVDGITPLMQASRNGDGQLVLELVQRGAVVDAVTPDGNSSLLCAVAEGHSAVVMALLDEGAAFNPIAAIKQLQRAPRLTHDGHWRIARHALLTQAKGTSGGQKLTSEEKAGVFDFLRRGVRDGQTELVRELLAKDTATSLLNREQALHLAASLGCGEVVREVLAHRTPVDVLGDDGTTPLLQAAKSGYESVVEELVLWGADLNRGDRTGVTPLMWAVQSAHFGTARVLLAHGADIDVYDASRDSALSLAIELNQVEMVTLLLDHQPDIGGPRGASDLLNRAVRLGHHAIVRTLLAYGLSANDGDALMGAVEREDLQTLRQLLSGGADANLDIGGGDTPLLAACRLGKPLAVAILMQFGANPWYKDAAGYDCFMVASISYHLSVITALISNGATVDALTQDVMVDVLTAGGFSKMEIREALTARGPVKAGTTNAFVKSLAVQQRPVAKRGSVSVGPGGRRGSAMGRRSSALVAPMGGRHW